jgi:hypothetical protein
MNSENENCNAAVDNGPVHIVWRAGHGAVSISKHETEMGARVEAARLARVCPGATYYVMRSVAACCLADLAWTETP